MLIALGAVLLVAVVCVAILYREELRVAWLLRHAPGPRTGGFFGDVRPSSLNSLHRQFRDWGEQYGHVYRLRMAHMQLVVVLDPTSYPEIFKLPKHPNVKNLYPLSFNRTSIVAAMHATPLWKTVRRAVLPVFSSQQLRARFPDALKVVDKFVEQHVRPFSGGKESVAFLDKLPVLMLHFLSHVGFEIDLTEDQMQPRVREMVDASSKTISELFQRSLDPTRKFRFWDSDVHAGTRTIKQYQKVMGAFADEVRAAALKVPYEQRERSIATALAHCKLPSGEPLCAEQMAAEVAMFFFAGMDTSSHQSAWILYLLATHPQCREKLARELEDAGIKAKEGGPPLRAVQYEDLGRLVYLNAVIQEGMRLEPVVAQGVARHADHDMQIGKVLVPRGTFIIMPFYASFTHSGFYPDPLKFQPERWLDSNLKTAFSASVTAPKVSANGSSGGCPFSGVNGANNGRNGVEKETTGSPSATTFPFSAGSRNCVGRAIAQMNMQLFLARLFAEFNIELAGSMTAEDAYKNEVYHGTSRPMMLDLKFVPW